MRGEGPIRVVHCVGTMNPGGVETWLMNLLRYVNPQEVRMAFCCLSGQAGLFGGEIETLGARVYTCRLSRNLLAFNRQFREVLEAGDYNVVHSHVHSFSGYILWRARATGVAGRVAHSHTTSEVTNPSERRRVYKRVMARLIERNATARLAASTEAGNELFGPERASGVPWQIVRCGIDVEPFLRQKVPREGLRAQLGLSYDAVVVGHVGRFSEEKNHRFFLEVAKQLAVMEPRIRFLLVGDGILRPAIEAAVRRADLSERFVFAGVRADIPDLLNAMDVFLMPSLEEGLPVAGLEAQASGTPVIFSTAVTSEAVVLPSMVQRLALDRSPVEWAQAVIRAVGVCPPTAEMTRRAFERGGFTVAASAKELVEVYGSIMGRSPNV